MLKHLATTYPMDTRPAPLPKDLQSPPDEKLVRRKEEDKPIIPSEDEVCSDQEKTDDAHSEQDKHTDSDEKDDTDYFMSGTKLHILICGLGLAVFIMALDMSILTTAIPKITEKFQSTEDIGWYISGYLLTV